MTYWLECQTLIMWGPSDILVRMSDSYYVGGPVTYWLECQTLIMWGPSDILVRMSDSYYVGAQ